jgi:hypothetical protein
MKTITQLREERARRARAAGITTPPAPLAFETREQRMEREWREAVVKHEAKCRREREQLAESMKREAQAAPFARGTAWLPVDRK